MSRRYLFMGGPADGTFRFVHGSDHDRQVIGTPPALDRIFQEDAPMTLTDEISAYYRHWVKFPGWKFYVKVYIIAGQTIKSLSQIKGYVYPGGVVGHEDSYPIEHIQERQQFLRETRDREAGRSDV